MRAIIVVESIWGNTTAIGRSVAAGLADAGIRVEFAAATDAPDLPEDVDLLVVGSPTHAFTLPTEATRRLALDQGAPSVPDQGVREWIRAVRRPPHRIPTAAFDTKTRVPPLPGSAAETALRRLGRAGFRPISTPRTFWVEAREGPLLDGERQRAHEWGRELTAALLEGL